jgi:transcription initiation factor IIE alpha subunit
MEIFLAPGMYRNIKRSIVEGVNIKELLDIKDITLKQEILEHYGKGTIKLWALKETLFNRWISIKEDDYILFYHAGKLIYASKVAFKYPFAPSVVGQLDVASSIAEKVWGRDVDGKTWSYLLFLKDVREINLPLEKFNELTGYNLKFVVGFMRISKGALKIIDYLSKMKVSTEKPLKSLLELRHDEIVDIIYALGEIIGYKPEKKWRHEGYEFDVIWNKPPRVGPKYVFEVHLKGSLEAALLRLKHAHDLWESRIFLVSTEDRLKEAETKFFGELHELKDKLNLIKIEDIKEFYNFKGKFEWLERKFGLRPT